MKKLHFENNQTLIQLKLAQFNLLKIINLI